MIEKVIHKKTLEKIYKEQVKWLNGWKKALRINMRILNKKFKDKSKYKLKYKPKNETEAVYDFIMAIGVMGLPEHIKSLEAKLKVIKRMIKKKLKNKKHGNGKKIKTKKSKR